MEASDWATLALLTAVATLWLGLIGISSDQPHVELSALCCGLASMLATAQATRP